MQIGQSFGRLDSLSSVLLIGRWGYYTSGQGFGLDASNSIKVFPREAPVQTDAPQVQTVTTAARKTVAHLRQWVGAVYVLRQPSEIPGYDSRTAAREAAHEGLPLAAPKSSSPSVARADLSERADLADAPWRDLADGGAIKLIDPWPQLCDDTACHAIQNDVGQYFDTNHVTNSAALRMRELFAPFFVRARDQALLEVKQ